jgi:hypothetical protein
MNHRQFPRIAYLCEAIYLKAGGNLYVNYVILFIYADE